MTHYMIWGRHPQYADGQWIKLHKGKNKQKEVERIRQGFECCVLPYGVNPNRIKQSANPYQTLKGFGLRVYHAETAIKKLADAPWADIYSRGFDNCFEAGDGDAVVWALMHKAIQEPDNPSYNMLTRGIRTMFSRVLNGATYPQDWLDLYLGRSDGNTINQLTLY